MTTQAMAELSPRELAAELGLPAEDAPFLANAPVRLPLEWLEAWRNKTGPRELLVADVAMLLGCSVETVYRMLRPTSEPRLRSRRGTHHSARISPADVVLYLRAVNAAHGISPTLTETPTQSAQRGETAKAKALAALGE